MAILSQWVFDQLILGPTLLRGKCARVAARIARAALIAFSKLLRDPIIYYEFHGTRLAMPMSHALPHILLRHPDYSANLGRIANEFLKKYPDLTMVDVGANIGDTIAIVRAQAKIPMLCIDGDLRYFAILKMNTALLKDIELECAYISHRSEEISARIDSHDGTGSLSIDPLHQTTVHSLEHVLGLHPLFKKAKILKIDTDGFDTLIVKGASRFLATAKPAVYLEYDPFFFSTPDPDGFDIFANLRNLGYETALFFKNTGEIYAKSKLSDTDRLLALHAECSGKFGKSYFDVCIIPEEDHDVGELIYKYELSRLES